MAHMIDETTGRAAMAYLAANGIPWHGLGTPMQASATRDEWRIGAGMNWEIRPADVEYLDMVGARRVMRGRKVLFRSDTGAPIAVMSDRYQVVQPGQVLDFFFDVSESQNWSLETAGVLREGAQYWALAKTGLGADGTDLYMLLYTSADGSLATGVQSTAVRVVCANTLSTALRGEKDREIKIRHNTQFEPKQIRRDLGLVDLEATWEHFQQDMRALAEVRVSASEATAIFSELLRPGSTAQVAVEQDLGAQDFAGLLSGAYRVPASAKTDKSRAIRGLDALETSYYRAPGACPGTGYGVLQGVTHYIDHVRGSDDGRLSSAFFGQGVALKDRAQSLVLEGDWRNLSVSAA